MGIPSDFMHFGLLSARISGGCELMKERFGPVLFFALRGMEKLIPIPLLYWLLKPLAACVVVAERLTVGAGTQGQTFRSRVQFHLNRCLEFFPDRLARPAWRERCKIDGLARVQEALASRRRVILPFVHSGSFSLLRYWLRAAGVPAATLILGNARKRSSVKRLKDRTSPFSEIPAALYLDQLKEASRFVAGGHPLLMAIDYERGRQAVVPLNADQTFRIATGAIRLAARHDAELIPCCLIDDGAWRFRLMIGRPVPRPYLAGEAGIERAAIHLLGELTPHIGNRPDQWHGVLARCFGSPRVEMEGRLTT